MRGTYLAQANLEDYEKYMTTCEKLKKITEDRILNLSEKLEKEGVKVHNYARKERGNQEVFYNDPALLKEARKKEREEERIQQNQEKAAQLDAQRKEDLKEQELHEKNFALQEDEAIQEK